MFSKHVYFQSNDQNMFVIYSALLSGVKIWWLWQYWLLKLFTINIIYGPKILNLKIITNTLFYGFIIYYWVNEMQSFIVKKNENTFPLADRIIQYFCFLHEWNESNIYMLFFLEKNKNVLYILSIKCKGLRRSLTIQYENAIWKNNLPWICSNYKTLWIDY